MMSVESRLDPVKFWASCQGTQQYAYKRNRTAKQTGATMIHRTASLVLSSSTLTKQQQGGSARQGLYCAGRVEQGDGFGRTWHLCGLGSWMTSSKRPSAAALPEAAAAAALWGEEVQPLIFAEVSRVWPPLWVSARQL